MKNIIYLKTYLKALGALDGTPCKVNKTDQGIDVIAKIKFNKIKNK